MNKMKTGFTFVEILVYLAVFSIISGAVLTGALRLVEFYNISRFDKEILNNTHFALNNMLLEIKYASTVYSPTSYTTNQISLETNLNPPSGENKTYVDFYLDNGRLYLKRESQDPQSLTSEKIEITNLNFTYLPSLTDCSSVKIEITARYRSSKEKYQRETSLVSSGALRKY